MEKHKGTHDKERKGGKKKRSSGKKKNVLKKQARDREDYWQLGLNPPIPSFRFIIGKAGLLQASLLLALQSK